MPDDFEPGRLFVLGAGFSVPAGLPTAVELLPLVRSEVTRLVGSDNHLERSLANYKTYIERCGLGAADDPVNFEDFAAFIDYEHFFRLRGSDTFSDEGNRDQLLLRWGIGKVLHDRTPTALPSVYLSFAEQLRPLDYLITFNYDLVLESALEAVGHSYRRFQMRYSEVGPLQSRADSEAEANEVVVLKPHGSIDWVSKRGFDDNRFRLGMLDPEYVDDLERRDAVFGRNAFVTTTPLLEGPRPFDDPMTHVHVVGELNRFYEPANFQMSHAPLILAPSTAKQLYGQPFSSFFEASGRHDYALSGFSVIGYSLPPADPYARQILYRIADSYGHGLDDPGWRIGPKRPIVMVDFRTNDEAVAELRQNYQFLDPEHTEWVLGGFDDQAVTRLFQEPTYLTADDSG